MNFQGKHKILFLTTAHHYNDDRIFYHQAKELSNNGFIIKISSLSSDFVGNLEGIDIESYPVLEKSSSEKLEIFRKIIDGFQPNLIIASEPLAILASKKIKKEKKVNIIYDITEWYPSLRMVGDFGFPFNIIHAAKFFLINLYAGYVSTHFIFGENTKKFPLAYFFPFKKKLFLPYFPDEKYIKPHLKKLEKNKITLCYTGVFSEEKGIGRFFSAIENLQNKKPELEIHILLIGASRRKEDQDYFENLLKKYSFGNLEIRKTTSFENFTQNFSDADICFDLRTQNFENHHCLPIKIFYYAACYKPVIYTDLKAIKQHVDINEFGVLVNPDNADEVSEAILKYVNNPAFYNLHAENARKEYLEKYNWQKIKSSFINFVAKAL